MLFVVTALNKPTYVALVIQDSGQTTNVGMYMDGLINAYIVFGAEFQSCCGDSTTVAVVTVLVSGAGSSLES
jgi:hypothetical protein